MTAKNPENEMRPEDEYRIPWEIRMERRRQEISALLPSFPPTLKNLLEQFFIAQDTKNEIDWSLEPRATYEALFLDEGSWKIFSRILDNEFSEMVLLGNLFRKFKSIDAIAKFISDMLSEGSNDLHYHVRQDRDGYRQDEWRDSMYVPIRKLAESHDFNEDEKKVLIDWQIMWESAIIELMCDENRYYVKALYGNEGTLSEFVGSKVFWSRIVESSIFKQGVYTDRLVSSIKYDEICNRSITRASSKWDKSDTQQYSNPREFTRQSALLTFLSHSDSETHQLPISFWVGLTQNPDFSKIVFSSLHKLSQTSPEKEKEQWDTAVKQVFLDTLGFAWEEYVRDPENFTPTNGKLTSMYVRSAGSSIDLLFNEEYAVKKLVDELGKPRYSTTSEKIYDGRSWGYEQINFDRPEIIVLHSVSTDPETGNVLAEYSVVSNTVVHRTVAELLLNRGKSKLNPGDESWLDTVTSTEGLSDEAMDVIQKEFRVKLRAMIKEYLSFEDKYLKFEF